MTHKKLSLALMLAFILLFSCLIMGAHLPQSGWFSFEELNDGDKAPLVTILDSKNDRLILRFDLSGFYVFEEFVSKEGLADEYKDYLEVAHQQGKAFTRIYVPDTVSLDETGSPELPQYGRMIQVPIDGKLSYTILDIETEEFKDILVFPAQQMPNRNNPGQKIPFGMNTKAYDSNHYYPESIISIDSEGTLRDIAIARVGVRPFQYNPASRSLKVHKSITVEIDIDSFSFQKYMHNEPTSRAFIPLYEALTINYTSDAKDNLTTAESMIVFVADSLSSSIDPFIDWKRNKGFYVDKVLISTVGSNTTSIYNYIKNAYDTWSNKPSYVVFVGNATTIPPFYRNTSNGNAASDYPYSLLTGGNYPDLFIGRIVASTTAQVDVQVSKIVNYEQNPDIGSSADWYSRAFGIASNEGSNPSDEDYITQAGNYLLGGTYTHHDHFFQRLGNATAANISNAINQGRSWGTYMGHGSGTSWGNTNTTFNNNTIKNLNNGFRLPIIIDVACLNGQFDKLSECFGEAWMWAGTAANPKGAVGYYGGSVSISWHPPAVMARGIAKHHFEDPVHTFGGSCIAGQIYMVQQMGWSNSTRENFEWYILFGDPSLMIRTSQPAILSVNHPSNISVGSTSVTISVTANGSAFSNALVGIVSTDDPGTYGSAYTNSSGIATINFSSPVSGTGDLYLTVTGYNTSVYQSNIPIGSSSDGIVTLDREVYSCGATAVITLIDSDLSGHSSYNLNIKSNTNPQGVSVNLSSTQPGTFTGSIVLGTGLAVNHNDTITVTYFDQNIGNGTSQTKTATAVMDCIGPDIGGLNISNILGSSAQISFTTSKPATSIVYYGLSTNNLNNTTNISTTFNTSHSAVMAGLSPNTTYFYKVRATDNLGNYTDSQVSSFSTPNILTIGQGTQTINQAPLYTYYHDNRTQTIYTSVELGNTPFRINALAFDVTTLPGLTMNNFTIRMKHTTKANYNSDGSFENTGWTTVYQANQTINSLGWNTFSFTTPFEYNGIDNLMLDISFDNSSWVQAYGRCNWTSTSDSRTIYAFVDSTQGDPLNWSGATNPTANKANIILNIMLSIETIEIIDLNTALNNQSLVFETGGDAPWYGQSEIFYFGGSSARSGTITHNQNTYMIAQITGPGLLTFYWKVSSELNNDILAFFMNNVQIDAISGNTDWAQKTVEVPAGTYTARWIYQKDASSSHNLDCGFVDKVEFEEGPVCNSPTISTQQAGSITTSSAQLNASGNPQGCEATVYFQWGTTTGYGNTTPGQNIGSGTGNVNVNRNISGLSPNTTYNYRAVISSDGGTVYGANMQFTTQQQINPPTVTTQSASDITTGSAVLNSAGNPQGSSANVYFQWGTTTGYGNTTPSQNIGSGTGNVNVSRTITGLNPNTTYNYRAVISSDGGTVHGANMQFTTHQESSGNFTKDVLIVNGDKNGNFTNHFVPAVQSAGYEPDVWIHQTSGVPPLSKLMEYRVIVWTTGDDWGSTTFTTEEENVLKNYLDNGGNLYFSSQDYLYARYGGSSTGPSNAMSFTRNYLLMNTWQHDRGYTSISGVSGDPVGNGLSISIGSGTFTNYPDYINPTADGVVFLRTGTNNVAIRCNGELNFRVVITGFSFENITSAAVKNALMQRVLDYLMDDDETPTCDVPTVSTLQAGSISTSSAQLNASGNPQGCEATVYFQWGTTTSYGNTTPSQNIGSGTGNISFNRTITGLSPNTIYNFRAVISSDGGTVYGSNMQFTTQQQINPPTVTTQSATDITTGSAVLNALGNPQGSSANVYFQWGTTTSYGNTTPTQNIGSGTANISFNRTITGLNPNTIYNFRAVISSDGGTVYGGNMQFTTHQESGGNFSKDVLIVNGDKNGNYTSHFIPAVQAAGYQPDTWIHQSSGAPSSSDLLEYRVVIWTTGNDYGSTTFTAAEETALRGYLDNGGNLYFSSHDYLYAVHGSSSSGPSSAGSFTRDYLLINTWTHDRGYTSASGVAGDPIGGGINLSIGSGAFTNYPDYINPTASGVVFMRTGTNNAALRCNGNLGFRLVTTGFAFENISSNADKNQLMQNILAYLMEEEQTPPQYEEPTVSTLAAGSIEESSAVLNGMGNPQGSSAVVYFQWGTSTSYGNTTSSQNIGSGTNNVTFNQSISNLNPGTNYYYRAVISSDGGTVYGANMQFSTPESGYFAKDVLIVNGDKNGNYSGHFVPAVQAAGYQPDVWIHQNSGSPTAEDLLEYKVVIWTTGNDYGSTTFTAAEETALRGYLDNGGNLYFSSHDYLYAKYGSSNTGPSQSGSFTRDYLLINTWTHDRNYSSIAGVAGDVLGAGVSLSISNVAFTNYPDFLVPTQQGITFLRTGTNGVAIRDNGTLGFKLVTTGFAFENISTTAAKNQFMQRVLNYLMP